MSSNGKGWIKTLTPSYGVSAAQRDAFVRMQIQYVEDARRYQQEQREMTLARLGRPKPGDFQICDCGHQRRQHSKDPATWEICVDGCPCTYFRRRAEDRAA